MYIHLGGDYVLRSRDIIGVFDIENTSVSRDTREFLSSAGKRGSDAYASYDMPKAFVVAEREGWEKVIITNVSPASIEKRCRRKGSAII